MDCSFMSFIVVLIFDLHLARSVVSRDLYDLILTSQSKNHFNSVTVMGSILKLSNWSNWDNRGGLCSSGIMNKYQHWFNILNFRLFHSYWKHLSVERTKAVWDLEKTQTRCVWTKTAARFNQVNNKPNSLLLWV